MVKIDSIVRISGGVLLNSPLIDSIVHINIYASKVGTGDLFIDINSSSKEREIAIDNGAYCILSASLLTISDEEIAWISVDSLEKSIIKLARFYVASKSIRFISLLNIQYELLKFLHVEQRIKPLSSLYCEALMQIVKSENDTLFFAVQNSFLNMIKPDVKKLATKIEPEQIFENGLFCSSFIYKGKYIKDSRLSSFFAPYLCSLMEYLDSLNIEFRVKNFNNLKHFYPQFVTSDMTKSDFGATRRAVIFESELTLFYEELVYLKKRVTKELLVSFTCRDRAIKEIPTIEFRYALIYGKIDDYKELIRDKESRQMEFFSDNHR